MPINSIFTFLVQPEKLIEQKTDIGGTSVPHEGKLFDLLRKTYENSDWECRIDIAFQQSIDGTQENTFRNLIVDHIENQNLNSGKVVAQRLANVTTNRSGMGLLFLVCGIEGQSHKIVISRFPADNGILAEQNQNDLSVEFLERVFMKSAKSYKSAMYIGGSLETGFWTGKAVDKQIGKSDTELSDYWITDFLASSFRTTPAAGTRRLAAALSNAAKVVGDTVSKGEITSFATLISNGNIGETSASDLFNQFNLSQSTRDAVAAQFPTASLVNERFQFDLAEFTNQITYRLLELDNGAVLSALSHQFDDVFSQEPDTEQEGKIKFSTSGLITNAKLRKTK